MLNYCSLNKESAEDGKLQTPTLIFEESLITAI